MASPETRQINAINATWAGASGAATDIDEPIGSPDTAYYGPGAEGDAADFGYTASEVVDGDTVTNISFNMIYRDDGTAGTLLVDVDLLIGGVVQGATQQITVSGSDATYSNINDTGWNVDRTAAEMDGAELRLTPQQSGMPGTTAGFLETANMVVTFSPPVTFTPELDGWIFHEDGTESGAAFIPFAENFGIMRDHTIAADLQFQLRVLIQEAAGGTGAGTDDYQLGYNKNGGGDVDITGSSTAIKADTASALTDGNATTDRMAGGTGTFDAGEQEKANGVIEDVQVGANNHTQLLYGLTGVEAEIASGDIFKFYMKLNGVKITSNVIPEIVFNAGPVIRATESDQSGSFTNAVTLTKPPSTVENDLMAAMGYIDDNAAAGDSWSVPALTGWVTEQGSNVQSVLAGMFSRIAGASEGATFAFDAAGTISDDTGGFMARIDGHNASTPIDVSGTGNGDSTSPTGPTITTTVDNCIVVTYVAVEDSIFDPDVAPPTGYTKGGEIRTGSNSEAGGFWAYKVQPSAGASGTQVWSTSLAVGWNAITFAVKPATPVGDKTVLPGAGALTLTGFAPTLVQTDNKIVLPGKADLALTGFVPLIVIAADKIVLPAAAALALEGFAPTLAKTDNKIVQPNKADLTLTGFVPTLDLTLDLVAQPAAAALTLTGFAPVADVAADKIVQPGKADLALTGFVPVLAQTDDKIVQPAQADLSLEGFAPTANLGADITIQVPQADLALEGFTPTVQRTDDHLVQPDNADLTLSGQIPTIVRTDDHFVDIPAGALALEGFAPIVSSDGSVTIDVPAGVLVLTGFAPAISVPGAGVTTTQRGIFRRLGGYN